MRMFSLRNSRPLASGWRGLIIAVAAAGITACTAGGVLSNMAYSFGQSLVSTSRENYGDDYTKRLELLLFAFAYQKLGLDENGQRPPPGGYGSYGYPDQNGNAHSTRFPPKQTNYKIAARQTREPK